MMHLDDARRAMEPDGSEMRRMVESALRRIIEHVGSLEDQHAANVEGAIEQARTLIEPMPETGTSYETLLDDLFDRFIPRSFNTAGPGYLAYIPGGGIFHSAVADLIADSVNRYVGVFAAAPLLAQLESNVIRWFSSIVGYPPESGGIMTTGGSMANLIAVTTARIERLPPDFLNGTIYVSDQVHHSLLKAAVLAGFAAERVRSVPSDERFCVRTDLLRELIDSDRQQGLTPFMIVGSAGTTNTGAVDDLVVLADIARDESLWFHVDAAYGGFFMLTECGRAAMRGIDRADSIALDPHKGLFLPYGNGSLLTRDRDVLRRAHSSHADYMPQMQEDALFADFCELSPELSRDFRGLRVWLPFKMHGVQPFRTLLDEKLDLARWATDRLREIDGIEIVAEPQLSIVAFRITGRADGTERTNEINRMILERINARKRVMLTGTVVRGIFVIRICVLSFRTHLERMEMAMEDIRWAIEDVRMKE